MFWHQLEMSFSLLLVLTGIKGFFWGFFLFVFCIPIIALVDLCVSVKIFYKINVRSVQCVIFQSDAEMFACRLHQYAVRCPFCRSSQRRYSGWEQKSGRTSVTLRHSFSLRSSFSLSLRSKHGSCLQARKHCRSTRLICRQMEGQTGTEQVSNNKMD